MNDRILVMLFFKTPKRRCLYTSVHPSIPWHYGH